MGRTAISLLILALLAGVGSTWAAVSEQPEIRPRPAFTIPRLTGLVLETPVGRTPPQLRGFVGRGDRLEVDTAFEADRSFGGDSPLGEFLGHLREEARGYSVWGSSRLHFEDPQELEALSGQMARAAEKIFYRSVDDYLGRRLDGLVDSSAAVARLRSAIDHYTSMTLSGHDARLGFEPDGAGLRLPGGTGAPDRMSSLSAGLPAAGPSRQPSRLAARLQVDLHPKVLLKSEFAGAEARLELPLSGSEYRFSLARPLTPRVSSELFAAYPRSGDRPARAGIHLFLKF